MTTIVVTHEDNEVDQFTFDTSDRVISIGRRSSNDVCIPNLSVSGMHARITIDGDSVSIEDNSSTNGTYVNGRLISRQLINDDDEIMIGRSSVSVQLSPEQLKAAQQSVETNRHIEEANAAAQTSAQDNASHYANNVDDDFDNDDSFVNDNMPHHEPDHFDDRPMSLSEKAKLALGREGGRESAPNRSSGLNGVAAAGVVGGAAAVATTSASAAASRAFAGDADDDVALAEAPQPVVETAEPEAHPLDDIDNDFNQETDARVEHATPIDREVEVSDAQISKPAGAVIEIQNGAKSGQVLPIDKPVTTLGRPGIQIAAIMRKPDGYFLMHIESDDSVEMPTLNRDTIGDDPVMLQSGDRLNVAGIDVEFMLS